MAIKTDGWHRKSWDTRCSDPTTVVEWAYWIGGEELGTITEFQNVYVGTDAFADNPPAALKLQHQQLEDEFEADGMTHAILEGPRYGN